MKILTPLIFLTLTACSTNGPPIGIGVEGYYKWRQEQGLDKPQSSPEQKTRNNNSSSNNLTLTDVTTSGDPRIRRARSIFSDNYGDGKSLTFRLERPSYIRNADKFKSQAINFALQMGGTYVERGNANFIIKVDSIGIERGKTWMSESYSLEIFTDTGAIASYSGTIKCVGDKVDYHSMYGTPWNCITDAGTIAEMFYKLAGSMDG